MFHCFQPIQGNNGSIAKHVRCIHCGKVMPENFPRESHDQQSTEECPSTRPKHPEPLPPLHKRVLNYLSSRAEYIKEGSIPCSDDVILERFNQCSTCKYYNDLLGACSVCGCWINLLRDDEGNNKLAWSTEKCPLNPPRWSKIDTQIASNQSN